MKTYVLGLVLAFALPMTTNAQDDATCENLKKVVAASQEYFKELRGEETTIDIRGVAKPYFKSSVEVKSGVEMLITADEMYPEAVSYLADSKMYSSELASTYEKLKMSITACLGEGWVASEKDKTNDIFLEDTEYKKFILKEDKKGKKVKIELYMYNQRELNKWVVELKIFGIGRNI
ncbi:MAG: hypothetical protein KBF73_06230 [Flavobacteriales bacterium]|nr:hypothetical protein [Flavobacteriales bacterium]